MRQKHQDHSAKNETQNSSDAITPPSTPHRTLTIVFSTLSLHFQPHPPRRSRSIHKPSGVPLERVGYGIQATTCKGVGNAPKFEEKLHNLYIINIHRGIMEPKRFDGPLAFEANRLLTIIRRLETDGLGFMTLPELKSIHSRLNMMISKMILEEPMTLNEWLEAGGEEE